MNTSLAKLKALRGSYPHQFWILIFGMLVSTSGISMAWPFMTIYIRKTLDVPLTTVAALITLSSVMTFISSFIVGPVSDRIGRKGIMVTSLLVNGATFYLFSVASTLPQFALLMAVRGGLATLYRVVADTMVADMLPEDKRLNAYALMRMAHNTGIAVGPAAGGFIAAASYDIAFYVASVVLLIYAIIIIVFIKETLSQETSEKEQTAFLEDFGGYIQVAKDRRFMSFAGSHTLTRIASILVFTLLSVYAIEVHGVPENQYGFLMSINAVMVVLFQYGITNFMRRFSTMTTLTIGALFYAVGVGSYALGSSFAAVAVSMVILTIGELMVAPTATTMVANLSPENMRGRYMSAFWLTTSAARAVGPIAGGLLNDHISPQATWVGGSIIALISALGYTLISRSLKRRAN